MIPPVRNPSSVEDIRELRVTGPWRSKSGGLLSVPFALSYAQTMDIFNYDHAELNRIPRDIRGLRMFVLEDIPAGGVGGGEFHRIRIEIVFTVKGRGRWFSSRMRTVAGSVFLPTATFTVPTVPA